MANRDNASGFRWYRTKGANAPIMDHCTLGGTVAVGDTLVISSGTCTIGLTTSTAVYGVAAQAGVSGDVIAFYPATPDQEFEAQCSGTFAASMIGGMYDIEGTTGIQEVNEDSTSYPLFQITGYNDNDTVGANTRVRGIFAHSSYTGID